MDDLVQRALRLWDLPAEARAEQINLSENVTYLVEAELGQRWVLRQHRPDYQSLAAIESELAWVTALHQDGVVPVPHVHVGRNGQRVQTRDGTAFVLFEFLEGAPPDAEQDLQAGFADLGRIAALLHVHARDWPRPDGFTRPHLDIAHIFGPDAPWGDWRAAPGVTPKIRGALDRVEVAIRQRLARFGTAPDRYGLIHGDMRFANLLIHRGETQLIDFDDCGFGWLGYDFAAAVSFVEDDPRLPVWKAAWLRGYRSVQPFPDAAEAELDTLILLRRFALLAWIGSHMEAPEPQALAPGFAETTARLALDWAASADPDTLP